MNETLATAAIVLLASAALATLIGLIMWYARSHSLLRKRLPHRLRFTPAHSLTSRRNVAFITDAFAPGIERIYQGFESFLLSKSSPLYNIDLFEGEGRTNTTREHLLHILSHDYDCIVTTSVFTTQLAQEVITSSGISLPIVFCNIPDSEYHIVQHPTAYRYTTGVLTERDIETEIAHVLTLRPQIRRALLLYPAVSRRWLEYQQEHILAALEMNRVAVHTLQLAKEPSNSIDPTSFDLIIVPPHSLTPAELNALAARCNKHRCTLYTTDFDAVTHGAAIGTGGGEKKIGSLAAQKVHTILSNLTSPHHVPITTHVPTAQVRLHKKHLMKQCLLLNESHLFVTECGEVYRGP